MSSSQSPGGRRPGGRTARNRAAVVEATLAELARCGYSGLTVENVAERSGVHKTTVYRRWGGVDGLIVDALHAAGEDVWAAPDTGALDTDLRPLYFRLFITGEHVDRAVADRAAAAAATTARAGVYG